MRYLSYYAEVNIDPPAAAADDEFISPASRLRISQICRQIRYFWLL
jgi:hypothetical protein